LLQLRSVWLKPRLNQHSANIIAWWCNGSMSSHLISIGLRFHPRSGYSCITTVGASCMHLCPRHWAVYAGEVTVGCARGVVYHPQHRRRGCTGAGWVPLCQLQVSNTKYIINYTIFTLETSLRLCNSVIHNSRRKPSAGLRPAKRRWEPHTGVTVRVWTAATYLWKHNRKTARIKLQLHYMMRWLTYYCVHHSYKPNNRFLKHTARKIYIHDLPCHRF